ncbi:MAG: ROK family protein [Anaerolineales bacterium]|jgi:fructokinase
MGLVGGVEAGGTKFVCIIASGPDDIRREIELPTTDPAETIGRVIAFFQPQIRREGLNAIGVASFGPLDLDKNSPTFGWITTTPKAGWANTNLPGRLSEALGVPAAVDTDVNASALAEQRWGAAQGRDPVVYLTVGTGIGAGGVYEGQLMHGLIHPEAGHMRIPHDREVDPFPGCCPFHRDCFEGLASGPAIARRWGKEPESLDADHPAWELEAHYIALGIANLICCLSPRAIILGGGVMRHEGLIQRVHEEVPKILGGYIHSMQLLAHIDRYIVSPGLGKRSGVLGAVALARDLSAGQSVPPYSGSSRI